jgi:hypothetical protein
MAKRARLDSSPRVGLEFWKSLNKETLQELSKTEAGFQPFRLDFLTSEKIKEQLFTAFLTDGLINHTEGRLKNKFELNQLSIKLNETRNLTPKMVVGLVVKWSKLAKK